MGEYATYKGERIKIGVCESLWGMRLSDINKVKVSGDSNYYIGSRFRLPWADEDHIAPGEYESQFRGLRLFKPPGLKSAYCTDYNPEWLAEADPGHIQLRHEQSGLQLCVPCHHGVKLPEVDGVKGLCWNGKGHSMELVAVKLLDDDVVAPIVQCRHCMKMWRVDWDEVLPFVFDSVMQQRLSVHNTKAGY
jgi:hypothetical protein